MTTYREHRKFFKELRKLQGKEIHLFPTGCICRGWWITRKEMSKYQWRKLTVRLKEAGFTYTGYSKDLCCGWYRRVSWRM